MAPLLAEFHKSLQAVAWRFSRETTGEDPEEAELSAGGTGVDGSPRRPELKDPASAQPMAEEPAARAHYLLGGAWSSPALIGRPPTRVPLHPSVSAARFLTGWWFSSERINALAGLFSG